MITAVEYLDAIAPEVVAIRQLRYEKDERFADAPDVALVNASRWLRAAAHSALEGARKLERIVRARHVDLSPLSVTVDEPEPDEMEEEA